MLRDEADLGPQRADFVAAHIDVINRHAAFLNIIEARDQIGEGRFAAAAHPDQRDHLARANRQG